VGASVIRYDNGDGANSKILGIDCVKVEGDKVTFVSHQWGERGASKDFVHCTVPLDVLEFFGLQVALPQAPA